MPYQSTLPTSTRYHSLDAWRGIACLMVVVCHSTFYGPAATPNDGLWNQLVAATYWLHLGVPMFFVISGYCISATADASRRKSIGFREYMGRRVRRIFPPWWVLLAVVVVLVPLSEVLVPGIFTDPVHPIENPQSFSFWEWIGNITLTETWRHHLDGGQSSWIGDGLFLRHGWTLCYEEQFYLVVGVAILLARKHFFSVMFFISAAVLVLKHVSQRLGFSHQIDGFFFDGSWQMFAAGILVYFQINYARRKMFVALNVLLFIAILYSVRRFPRIEVELFTALVFAGGLIALSRWDSSINTMKAARPFTYCGTICYSLYLVHWPVVKLVSHTLFLLGVTSAAATLFITVPICLAASVLCASLFFHLVERHFLNSPSKAMPDAGVARSHPDVEVAGISSEKATSSRDGSFEPSELQIDS